MPDGLVVVGAGSAGAVIATRVTEDSRHHVTLYEAGPDYTGELPEDLTDGRRNSMRAHDWGYRFLPNRTHELNPLPRGKVTGGSSAVNTCIALRGQPYDYEEWADIAGEQWRFDACLPAFKRLENDQDIRNQWHGNSGPIKIRRHTDAELVRPQRVFVEACRERGWPSCPDHNDPTTTGVGAHAMNKINGVRISTAMGYLSQSRQRDNLDLQANTLVRRVLISNRKVTGVEIEQAGRVIRREAKKVVLSAGAIATPGILMRSGIGPRAQLAKMGVALVADLPVGQQLLDHLGAVVVIVPPAGFCSPDAPLIQTTLRYASDNGPGPNDMQLQPGSFVDLPGMPLIFVIAAVLGKPQSKGCLTVPDANPRTKPHIFMKLGEHADDRARILAGLRHLRDLMAAPSMKGLVRAWPNDEQLGRTGDSRWLLPGVGSGYHPCGTTPMGPADDTRAVVDGFGRVHGVAGLFVVDAGIMPTIPTSNLNLPTIMMGERFGEWFREGKL